MKILSPFFVFSALAVIFSFLFSLQGSPSFVESSSTPDDWTLSYVSNDNFVIGANAYSGVEECVGLSTNNGNDGICATAEKSLVKVTFAPFTFGTATTSTTSCKRSFALESENLAVCADGSATLFFFELDTFAAHPTTPSISVNHFHTITQKCGTFLIILREAKIYKIDLTNLAGGAVEYETSLGGGPMPGGFSQLVTNTQGTRFVAGYLSFTQSSLLVYDIPTTASDPVGADVDRENIGSTFGPLVLAPGTDDKNFKVYLFNSGSFLVYNVNTAGFASYNTIRTELTIYTDSSTANYAIPNTNLLVVGGTLSASIATVFVFDTSTNKVTHTAVALNENQLKSMVSVKESDDTIKFHIFTSAGTNKVIAKFDKTQPSDAREPTFDPITTEDWILSHSSSTAISGFTGVEKCVKVSKNQNQGDVICSSTEKQFIRATLSPFTVTDESSTTTACAAPYVFDPVPASVGCVSPTQVINYKPFSFGTAFSRNVASSPNYMSVPQKNKWLMLTDGDANIIKATVYSGGKSTFDIKTANSLKPKQIVHNAEGTKAVVSVVSSSTATDTSIALLNIPISGAPTFITSQAVTGLTTPFEHLFYRPGADADNFKVYGFAEGKMAVIDITGGNTIAITLHSTSTSHGDFPLAEAGVFLPTPETATHLVLGGPKSSSDSDAALFVIDLSTNDYYKAPVSGCNSGSSFKSMVPKTKSTTEIDFHVFTSAGTEHCVFNFKYVTPTPAPPTPAPTPVPPPPPSPPSPGTPGAPPVTPAPSPPSGGNNQQNNNNDEAASSPRTKAVIASTSVIGGLGLIAVVGMIIYAAFFKNKKDEESAAPDSEMTKKEGGNNNNTNNDNEPV